MDETGGDVRRVDAGDERSAGAGDTAQVHAAHEEYLREAQGLIDEQTSVLFATVQRALSAGLDNQPDVQRADHILLLRVGGATPVEFAVEAITDLPEGTDRALAFTRGQARCRVRVAGTTVAEWVLSRVDVGSEEPVYAWLHAETSSPVTDDDIVAVVRR